MVFFPLSGDAIRQAEQSAIYIDESLTEDVLRTDQQVLSGSDNKGPRLSKDKHRSMEHVMIN